MKPISTEGGISAPTTICPISLSVTNLIQPSASVISVKRYAEQEGISPQAAHRRIQSGRLEAAVTRVGRRVWIDPKVAAIEWAKHGRPCNSRAAQLEQLLTATAPKLAAEVAGQSPEYCRAAIWRWLDDVINRTA